MVCIKWICYACMEIDDRQGYSDCTAFSIQFHKKFMTFYRFAVGAKGGRNSRIDSLFNVLGIPHEHIYQGDVFKVDAPIQWDEVDENLSKLRDKSISFLNKALS